MTTPKTDLPLHIDVNHLSAEQAVGSLIEHAAKLGVSDLFLWTNENHLVVAARHLGILRPVSHVPTELGRRCVAHIKALAGMDVSERRRPLDGRWLFDRPSASTLDLRINMMPTLHGEDVTLRLLDRDTRLLEISQLGLARRDYNQLLALLHSPSGLILVTGPTGSGKSTTLYACLRHLNNGERKINTIEDPIEYAIPGIRQSQVNHRLDVGFPELLRSVLRQAPDVIMVGEIRDPTTAETAVRAANSGHLVLATLHAPVAVGAIPIMLNLGVHPHFLASSLLGVVSQRLVRTLCGKCRERIDIDAALPIFEEVRRYLGSGDGQALYGPRGCEACRGLGFTDRTGVFEVLAITTALRRMILDRQPVQVLGQKALEEGLIPFRLSALLKVAQGETSIEEVFRAVPTEFLAVE